MIAFNDTDGIVQINATVMFIQPVLAFISIVTIKAKGISDKNYDRLIFKTSLNHCNVQKGVIGSFLVKTLVEKLKDYSNFTFECPQPVGFYYCSNFQLDVFLFDFPRPLFKTLMRDSPMWETVVETKGKVGKSRPLVLITSWKAYGTM